MILECINHNEHLEWGYALFMIEMNTCTKIWKWDLTGLLSECSERRRSVSPQWFWTCWNIHHCRLHCCKSQSVCLMGFDKPGQLQVPHLPALFLRLTVLFSIFLQTWCSYVPALNLIKKNLPNLLSFYSGLSSFLGYKFRDILLGYSCKGYSHPRCMDFSSLLTIVHFLGGWVADLMSPWSNITKCYNSHLQTDKTCIPFNQLLYI